MFNKAGKTLTIFVILIVVLLLSSTSIGFYLYHVEQRLHKTVETELDSSRAAGIKLQAQLKDVQAQLALAQDKNRDADQKINNLLDEQDLNEGLRKALKKENADLKTQIADLNQAKEKMKADLNDSAAKLAQYQDLLKNSEEKTKQLETHLASLIQTNKNLQNRLEGPQGTATSGSGDAVLPRGAGMDKMELDKIVVSPQNSNNGHVLTVDTDAEFVIFNMGLKQGIKPDDELSVYRADQYLGDIKATRVQDDMSAADIIPPLTAKDIHKNDIVVVKP